MKIIIMLRSTTRVTGRTAAAAAAVATRRRDIVQITPVR